MCVDVWIRLSTEQVSTTNQMIDDSVRYERHIEGLFNISREGLTEQPLRIHFLFDSKHRLLFCRNAKVLVFSCEMKCFIYKALTIVTRSVWKDFLLSLILFHPQLSKHSCTIAQPPSIQGGDNNIIIIIIVSSVRSSYSHPDLLLITSTTTTPLFQITPVLNTGLSLSEPLQLYKGYNAI